MNELPVKSCWPPWSWLILPIFLAFAILTWLVLAKDLASLDLHLAQLLKTHAEEHPWLRNVFWALTHLGDRLVLVSLAVAGILLGIVRKDYWLAAFWVLTVAGGGQLNHQMKKHFHLERPDVTLRDEAVKHLTNESYPSGHAMGATVGFGMFVYLAALRFQRQLIKALAGAGLVLLILLIGFSRMYLRAHWCSDVLGGFTAGSGWLLLGLASYERWVLNPER